MSKQEQNRKKRGNSATEFLKFCKKRTFYFSKDPKKFSFFQNYKKNIYAVENEKTKERKYVCETFFTKQFKAEALEQTLNKKSSVKIKLVNISNVLKKIKRGFLLNTCGAISFILRNPHEGKATDCGKSIYLEILKLKLTCREDKTLLNKVISKVGPTFELKNILRMVYEKNVRYTCSLTKSNTKKSIRVYCCQKKTKLLAKIEKETVGCYI